MRKSLSILLFLFFLLPQTKAGDKSAFEISGDILEYAMPAAALASTFIWTDDSRPTLQFAKTVGVAVGTAYILKSVIDKRRPDFNPNNPRYDSFPSGHTTSAFMSAGFLERRFGWKVGIPAYLTAAWVGSSRVYAERHDWWDVLGGAVLGTGSSYLFTKAYKKDNLDVALNISSESFEFGLKVRF